MRYRHRLAPLSGKQGSEVFAFEGDTLRFITRKRSHTAAVCSLDKISLFGFLPPFISLCGYDTKKLLRVVTMGGMV
jgi:hypothetical protein